jgi:hypothetical protein
MNIIFLDIDETLNCISNSIRCKQLGLAPYSFQGFNPISIGLLQELVSLSNAKIVLSSTWRLHYQSDEECISEFKNNMKEHYSWDDFPIIGRTCGHFKKNITDKKWSIRGDEIKVWLDNNNWTNYVIIDDSDDMLAIQKKHFVKVHRHDGFNFKNFLKCLKIFDIQSNYFTI